MPLWRLEPYAVKVARTVLRRTTPCNRCRLSDPFQSRAEVNDAAIPALIIPLTEWVINILIT
jgi:hypothetical protein